MMMTIVVSIVFVVAVDVVRSFDFLAYILVSLQIE